MASARAVTGMSASTATGIVAASPERICLFMLSSIAATSPAAIRDYGSGADRFPREGSLQRVGQLASDGLPVKIGVGAVQPVLADGAEDVHVHRVLEGLGPVRHVRRNDDERARPHRHLLLRLPDPQAQGALEDVGDLLADVRMS